MPPSGMAGADAIFANRRIFPGRLRARHNVGGARRRLVVPVAHPVERKVQDYVYYTGRTKAKNPVTIVPRVTGYLEKMPFKEGSEVKAGALLFEIDDRPYKAQYEAAKAAVAQNEASLRLCQGDQQALQGARQEIARLRQQARTRPVPGPGRSGHRQPESRQGQLDLGQAQSRMVQHQVADRRPSSAAIT